MSLLFYKVLHVVALAYLFAALGAVAWHAAHGGRREAAGKGAAIAHGLALVVLLVSGFGMIAKLGVGFPGWVWAKLALWFALGAAGALPYKKPEWSRGLFWLLPLLAGVAGWLALYKPF
ncbi:MAG: hypothetical protein ACRD0X_04915 [Thermoanaerobaculia bacterium]